MQKNVERLARKRFRAGQDTCFEVSRSDLNGFRSMPPFDSIKLSDHLLIRGRQRGYTAEQARACIERYDRNDCEGGRGKRGGFIWYFRKSFEGRTLQIVAEVHENRCYGITGYWR